MTHNTDISRQSYNCNTSSAFDHQHRKTAYNRADARAPPPEAICDPFSKHCFASLTMSSMISLAGLTSYAHQLLLVLRGVVVTLIMALTSPINQDLPGMLFSGCA
jgi:hypothetical protein